MSGEVIPFPRKQEDSCEEVVRSPVALFTVNDRGQVDLAEGVAVSDAVTQFWEAVQSAVTEAWADHPLGRERARVHRLTAYLDDVRPGWREDMSWKA